MAEPLTVEQAREVLRTGAGRSMDELIAANIVHLAALEAELGNKTFDQGLEDARQDYMLASLASPAILPAVQAALAVPVVAPTSPAPAPTNPTLPPARTPGVTGIAGAPRAPGAPGRAAAAPLARVGAGLGAESVRAGAAGRIRPQFGGPAPTPSPSPWATVGKVVVAALGALFGLGGGGMSSAVASALNGIRATIAQTADSLMRFAWRIARGLGAVLKALQHVWVRVISPIMRRVRDLTERVVRIFDRVLKPYYEWIRRVQLMVRELYEKYLRPVLLVIQTMRRIMAVLAIMRVPFARRIDRELVKLQARIMEPLDAVLRKTNELAGWMNIVVNTRGLLQEVTLLASLDTYRAAWTGMAWREPADRLAQVKAADEDFLRGMRDERGARRALEEWAQHGTGPLALPAAAASARLRQHLAV